MRVPGIPFIQGRNTYSDRDGRKFGIAIHATANTASAQAEANYATRRTDGVSAHLYVDDEDVIQSLDTEARAGHAGSSTGNDNAVAVEITGLNSWTREQWIDRVAWDKLAHALAPICRKYGTQPRRASVAEMERDPRVRAFYGHNDMRLAWGGTTHTDPGPNFPWDHLLATVGRALDGDTEDDMLDKATDTPIIQSAVHNTRIGKSTVTIGVRLEQLGAVPVELAEARLRQEAILRAVTGQDYTQVVEAIRAEGERTRQQLDVQAVAEAGRDAELLALVQAGQDGSVEAAEVVRRIGELLTAGQGQARG